MTSRSHKSHRTTASATTTRRRATFSLLALGGWAAVAVAQPPVAPPPADWSPTPPVVEYKGLPQLQPLTPPPAPVVMPPGGGQMTFQKRPGETAPVQPTRPFPGTLTAQTKPDDKLPAGQVAPPPADKSKAVEQKGMDRPAPALPSTPGGLPVKADVFRFDDDATLNARILKDLGKKADEKFPPLNRIVPAGTQYVPKTGTYAPVQCTLEPGYVVHRRMYFEELNSERHGWDAGLAQPIFSTFYFYKDALLWPHNLASGLWHERYDTSAGKCLPGSPVPYTFYPPGFTVSGSITEALILTGTAVILP